MVAMSNLEYNCPDCGKPSQFVKTLAPKLTKEDGTSETITAVLVKCPQHGEMVIRPQRQSAV
jgi:predicted RNA-binding Zn-ribbon protein involved in translation (DUF1610 family)